MRRSPTHRQPQGLVRGYACRERRDGFDPQRRRRVLREPDAFPAADIGPLRALARSEEGRPSTAEVVARAEAWRPWRAYAAQHLWTLDTRTARGNTRTSLKENVDGHPS